MNSSAFRKTLRLVSGHFDSRKVGHVGGKGYRKTTDLGKLSRCMEDLAASGVVAGDRTVFADLGCGDGRVNLLASYFVKTSIGIEIDSEILSEYGPGRSELFSVLEREGGIFPPENVFLFRGDSLSRKTFGKIRAATGVGFEDVDLFYTYITLHDVFAEAIAERGRPGAYFLVYGFNRVLPRYDSLELVLPDVGSRAIAALFRKPAR